MTIHRDGPGRRRKPAPHIRVARDPDPSRHDEGPGPGASADSGCRAREYHVAPNPDAARHRESARTRDRRGHRRGVTEDHGPRLTVDRKSIAGGVEGVAHIHISTDADTPRHHEGPLTGLHAVDGGQTLHYCGTRRRHTVYDPGGHDVAHHAHAAAHAHPARHDQRPRRPSRGGGRPLQRLRGRGVGDDHVAAHPDAASHRQGARKGRGVGRRRRAGQVHGATRTVDHDLLVGEAHVPLNREVAADADAPRHGQRPRTGAAVDGHRGRDSRRQGDRPTEDTSAGHRQCPVGSIGQGHRPGLTGYDDVPRRRGQSASHIERTPQTGPAGHDERPGTRDRTRGGQGGCDGHHPIPHIEGIGSRMEIRRDRGPTTDPDAPGHLESPRSRAGAGGGGANDHIASSKGVTNDTDAAAHQESARARAGARIGTHKMKHPAHIHIAGYARPARDIERPDPDLCTVGKVDYVQHAAHVHIGRHPDPPCHDDRSRRDIEAVGKRRHTDIAADVEVTRDAGTAGDSQGPGSYTGTGLGILHAQHARDVHISRRIQGRDRGPARCDQIAADGGVAADVGVAADAESSDRDHGPGIDVGASGGGIHIQRFGDADATAYNQAVVVHRVTAGGIGSGQGVTEVGRGVLTDLDPVPGA